MEPAPRKWQERALPRVLDAIDREVRGVVRATTGAGKSTLIAEICRMRPDDRIVVTTPTQQLVWDLSAAIADRLGESVGRFYGPTKLIRRVTVTCNASIATLARNIGAPDLLIADECHKTEAPVFLETLENWTPRKIVGVTATAYRSDDSQSLTLFDELIFNLGPADAIRAGIVVPPVPVHPRADQGTEINEICVNMIREQVGPGVVDATNIKDAQEFSELLIAAGVRCAVVHSQMDASLVNQRKTALDNGEINCLVHVDMLSEGVDMPNLRWLCLRRKTGARVRFAQYVGRGLRAVPGKTHCNVLDPWDLFNLHSLDWEACLGGDDAQADDVGLAALRLEDILDDIKATPNPDDTETLNGVPVTVLDPAAGYIRRLRFAMETRGVIPFESAPQLWRNDRVTVQDLQRIDERMRVVNQLSDDIPAEHYRALWIAYRAMRAQKRGTASDMNRILKALQWNGWPEILNQVGF
ncbi:MAG TPA: DEAD/DEAH box helicase family protein [candidate division Zixibacteria bacterium]|nr:DEAD/DEAH box helicase family protein [candidate division Zixibacteria bacterium]